MYHCTIAIMIFSQDSMLKTLIQSITPFDQFEHRFYEKPYDSDTNLAEGDILIFEEPVPGPLREIRRRCKKSASIIVCRTPKEIEALDDDDFFCADEYWEKPLDGRIIRLRFQALLRQRKLKKDYALSCACLDTLIDSMPDMVWFKDTAGIHRKVNSAFCHMVAKTREDVTGRDHCYIWNVSHDDPDSGEQACKDSEDIVMRKGKTCQFTEKVKSQHGVRQFITYKSPLTDEDGTVIGTVGIGHDTTDLENLGTELEIFLRSMPFAILIYNDHEIITSVNEKFETYFGVLKDQVIGHKYNQWSATAFEDTKSVNNEGFVEAGIRTCNSQPARVLELREEPIYDVFETIAGHLCIYRDVTVERQLERQILMNSNTDFMTGLYNRRCFYQFIHNNRSGKTISLLYVDLDHFKKVNDTYGHQFGDKALICAADVMRECFPDEFIARIGGDEFLIVILGECSIRNLKERSQKLLDRMHEAFHSVSQFSFLSASIGIAQSTTPDLNIDQLIQESDMALYQAKQMGRGRYCLFQPDL